MNAKKLLSLCLLFVMLVSVFSFAAFATGTSGTETTANGGTVSTDDGSIVLPDVEIDGTSEDGAPVAQVGDVQYATIDEAIAAWTNGTTLTLLADVTLSDVIKISSTEKHVLNLGTYTMTAAKNKDAIQYVVNGRTSLGYALDIIADATNPGGITATGGSVVRHTKPMTGAPSKDRPITRFYGGVFNASYVVRQGGTFGAGYTGASAPAFYFYGGEYNGTIYTNRSINQFHGGTFNGSMQMSVDSSAYTLIAGGTFKNLSNSMGSALNSEKFTIGSAKGVYDKDVVVDENGNYVIGTAASSSTVEASVAQTPDTNNYFAYSKVATEGAFNYTDVETALKNNSSAEVTVYADEVDMTGINFEGTIVIPQGESVTITNAPANLTVTNELGGSITPNADGTYAVPAVIVEDVDVEIIDNGDNTYDIKPGANYSCMPEGGINMTFAAEGDTNGMAYVIHEHEGVNYIYVGSVANGKITINNTVGFSIFTVNEGGLAEALAAAQAGTGEVTVTLLVDVTENVTINEKVGLYLTIDGAGKTWNGNITINPLSDTNDNRRITVQNVNFVNTADTAVDFIAAVKNNHYPRLSVLNCTFTGNGKDTDVAIRTKSAYDLIIKNCTGTGLHSFLQNTSGVKVTVQNVTVADSKGGLAMGTAQNVTVRGCNVDTRTYGIRLDAVLDTSVTLNGNVVKAYVPVSVRNATASDYQLSFSGSDSIYTPTNADGVWCAICATEYEEGKELNEATGNVKVTFNTDVLDESSVYGAYEWPVVVVFGDGFTKGFDSLTSAMNFGYSGSTEKTIIVKKDITESMDSLEGNIVTDNPNGVTIKNTIVDAWIYCSEDFTIGEGVTYDATGYASGLFMYAENAVINGTVIIDCYYQRYANTKLTINEPGSMTVKTETFILRYTDGDAKAGIYINGDNNDETVGLNSSVIYFYQGVISAKDADIKVGTYWQTNATDNEGSANLVLDNSNMTVTVNEHKMKATGNSTVTLTNRSSVDVAGGYEGVDVEADATSTFTKNGVSLFVAQIGEVKYTSLQAAINAATGEIVLIADVTENITIADGATVVLNLNGKTLNGYIAPCTPASLTIKNGSIANNNSGYSAIEINAGELVLENVNIDSARHAVRIDGAVTATVNGGTYKSAIGAGKGTYHAFNISGTATVVIDGGKFVGPAGTTADSGSAINVKAGSSVTINGGDFSGGKNKTLASAGTLTVYGGTFDQNPSSYIADGYCVVDENGSYVVAKAVVMIGTTGYPSLQHAINAAQAGDTIVLLENLSDVDATISKNIVLDLAGNTITDAYIIITGDVTIKDGFINNVNEPYPLVVQNGGNLVINDVAIEASKSDRAIWVRSGSSLVFNSGSILATKGANNTKTNLIAAIYTDSNTDVTINGGTITVDTPDNKAIGIFGNYTNANVTVNGGKISTNGKNYSYGVNVDGDITVTGGEIVTNEKGYGYSSGIRYGNNYALVSATGDVTITGGTITTNGYSGYIVNVGRSYSSNDQTVTITGGTLTNNLSEVEQTTGGSKAPALIWEGSASKVTATITNGNVSGFSPALLKGENTDLAVSGGTFDVAINEEYLAEGFKQEQNDDGSYGVVVDPAYGMVAQIGDNYYATLAEALTAAADGDVITLLWKEGDAPIAMNGAVYGKTVTITGTATVDWAAGFLFVGRGGAGNGTVIFENATLTSATNSASAGIHVSGREKDTDNKYDGTLILKNSTIELDYLINKGAIKLEDSTLIVKNGFSLGGRPADETENGEDATATVDLVRSTLVVNNHNGMGIGYEAIGVMNVDADSTFKTTQSFLVTAKGTLNVNGGTLDIAGTFTNDGTVSLTNVDLTNVNIVGSGTTYFYGDINFYGANTVTSGINGSDFELIVNKGANLLINRFVLGYNRNITVYGDIADAHAFDPANQTPSLKFNNTSGVSVGGTGTGNLTVKDAYVELDSSSWKNAYGTYTWSFENAYVSATSFTNNNAQGSASAQWTVTFDDSVLAAKNYIKNGVGTTYNFINGSVATTGSLRIDGKLYIDETSSVTTTSQQNNKVGALDEHGGINGAVTVDGTLTIGSTSKTQLEMLGGSLTVGANGKVALGNNSLTLDADSGLTVDITGKTAGDAYDAIEGAVVSNGTVKAVNNDPSVNVKVDENGNIVIYSYSIKIGDNYYETLAEAVAAANAGDTVVLLDDVVLSETLVIPAGKSITLDLNGKTISQVKECTASYEMIANNGALTITGNGKISFTDTGAGDPNAHWGVYTIRNSGTLVIENGTIENLSAQNQAGQPFAHTTLAIFQYSGSTTINGGTISTPNYRSVRLWSGDLTINGGTFEGQVWVHCVNDTSVLTIKGGSFAPTWNDGSSVFVNNSGYVSSLTVEGGDYATKIGANSPETLEGGLISGGTFGAAVAESLCAEGFIPQDNGDGTYGVKVGAYVARNTTTGVGYETLEEAFKAATDGCTIEILADVVIDYKWDCRDYATNGSHSQFRESVTINGNGHKITFTGTVNDNNWNTIFRFEENATVNDLTVDISAATGVQRVITAKKSLTVNGLTIIGSAKYGVIFGEGASADDLAATEIAITNSVLTGTRRAISDNEGGKDVKSIAITNNQLSANVYVSASDSVTFTGNTVDGGDVDIRSYAGNDTNLTVVAKDNTLDAERINNIIAKNVDAQSEFATKIVVSTWDELAAAIANVTVSHIVLANDITAEGRLVVDRDLRISLNGKSLYLTQKNNRVWKAATLTIDGNGVINVSAVNGGNVFYVGGAETGAGTQGHLVLNNIAVYGENYNTGTNAAVFMLYGPASSTLSINGCEINLKNNLGNGSVFYDTGTNNQCKINIVNSDLVFDGTVRGSVCGDITIDNSTVLIQNCDNGFNEATLTIKNGSDVTIINNTGRGITVNRNGYGIVIEDSKVTLANNGEGDIRYKSSANIQITNSEVALCNVVVDDGKTATINGIEVPNGAKLESVNGTVAIHKPVSKIGNVYYFTLADAIAAATDGCIIELLADVEISGTLMLSFNSAFDKIDVTLNGNGHTIKAVGTAWNDNTWLVDIAWNVVLSNITFDGNNTGSKGVQFYTSESVLNNVTIKNISADKWGITDYAIHANASDLTVTGTLTIENCKHGMIMVDMGSNTGKTASIVDVDANATVSGASVVLNHKDASLTDPTGTANVQMGDVAGYFMVNENGTYKLVLAVASINGVNYASLADALAAAKAMTGDVVVKIFQKVTLNSNLSGNFDSIAFIGEGENAEIYLDVQGYITAPGKKVSFADLKLSKVYGAFMNNAGFMNVAFGVYDVAEVNYTNCVFLNGAYASSGKVTYTGCTFYRSHDKYGLWAYGNVDVTVDNCIFADYRGIKMYAEGAAKTVDLTVKNSDFSALTGKPAIVLTYGESVTLAGNTYSETGVFELDLGGAPNGTPVTSTDPITCVNDNGDCGVLANGKIYTTLQQAVDASSTGSTVTLLHNTDEVLVLPAGITLDKNGYTAANVKNAVAQIGNVPYASLQDAIAAAQDNDIITLYADVTLDAVVNIEKAITLDLNGKTVTGADGEIVFNVKAATTIQNGFIKGNKSGTSSGLIDIYADLVLNGVNIETSKITALRFKVGGLTATLTDCNVVGAFKGYGTSVWNIVSGTYKASSTAISDQLNGSATVFGGTFHYEIAAEKCAPGYAVVDNGDGTYGVKYAPVAFVDANNNGVLDDGEVIYGSLEAIFKNYQAGDVYIVLTDNVTVNAKVDTDVDAKYYLNTNVAEGVAVNFAFADDWNFIQNMYIGENVTVNAKYLYIWGEVEVSGTVNTDYFYMHGATVTVEENGVVNAATGDATVQVKNGANFTVKGKVNTAILNVWVDGQMVVDGANAKVDASWIDIWDGAPSVSIENGATVETDSIKVSRGGAIALDNGNLNANTVELGHNGTSAGTLTEAGNSTITGDIKMTTNDSVVNSDGGLNNVTTNIDGHMVVYTNGTYQVVPVVATVNGTANYATVQDALNAAVPGDTVTILAGDYTMTLNVNKAITVVGETDENGNNLVNIAGKLNITADGAAVKHLNINNGGSSAGYINAKDVLVEGCTVVGGNGFRSCYTTGLVTFKDSTITGSTYGIHFDGSEGGEIVIDNCVITGWTSFARTIKSVTMTGTEFKEGNYNYVRFYQENIVIEGCTFNEKMGVDIAISDAELAINNSTLVNGNVEDLFEEADMVNSTITVDGVELVRVAQIGGNYYETFDEALSAAVAGDTIVLHADIELSATLNIREDITLDGNGHKMTQAAGVASNNHAYIYVDSGSNVTFENITFDGIQGSVIRTVDANVTIDNCVFQNGTHTGNQGIVRLNIGSAVVKNSKFLNNVGTMILSFNYDAGNATDTLVVDNCLFEGNTANETAILYYVTGESCTITKSEFVNNTTYTAGNGATIYLGFTENNVVTGNLFENNKVVSTGTSTRVGGAIFFGYEAEVSGNAFVGNTASNANGDVLGQICTSTFYDCDIDLGENYWGGNAPVPGVDFTVQHQTGDADLIVDNYYPSYSVDENGNVTVDEATKVELTYVAQIGKIGYATLADAIAAAKAGDEIKLISDITLNGRVNVSKSITLNGNGYSISGNFGLYFTNGTYTIDNVVFENINYSGINGILEFVYATANITNCTFKNNNANSCIAVDCNANNDGTSNVTVDACTFEGNECSVSVINVAEGTATVKDCAIIGNTANIALIYTSSDTVVSGCYFSGNTLTGTNANKAAVIAGPYRAGEFTVKMNGNAFNDNFLAVYVEDWSAEYGTNTAYDLDGNYWNGSKPNYGKSGDPVVTLNTYYASADYTNGTLTLSDEVAIVYVAQIGNAKYETLQAAIDAATAGDVISFIEGLSESVTVKKSITIDGQGKSYTGTIAISGKVNVTVQNVKFVQGSVSYSDSGTYNRLTVKDSTFQDGGYAVTTSRVGGVIIENCKVFNQSLLYAKKSTSEIIVKDVTILGGNYGAHIVYNNTTIFENVTMVDVAYGIMVQNYGAKKITLKNCDIRGNNPIYTWEKATATDTFVIEGATKFVPTDAATFAVSQYAKIVLADENATLEAPANLAVTESIEHPCYKVVYENGIYKAILEHTVVIDAAVPPTCTETGLTEGSHCSVCDEVFVAQQEVPATDHTWIEATVDAPKHCDVCDVTEGEALKAVASVNGVNYASIQAAVDAAQDGDTVVIESDVTLVWDGVTLVDNSYAAIVRVAGKTITIDLNGHKLTGNSDTWATKTVFAVFAADDGGKLTLTGNGTIEVTGQTAAYSLIMAYENDTYITIENGNYYLETAKDSLLYAGGYENVMTVNDGNFKLGNVGTGTNGSPWIINVLGQNYNYVIVNGGTFNSDICHQFWANEVFVDGEKYALQSNSAEGTWSIVPAVAYIEKIGTSTNSYSRFVGYATIEEALTAAKAGDTITLVQDIALENGIVISADDELTIDLAGHTMSMSVAATAASALITNNGTLTITDSSDEQTGKLTYFSSTTGTGYSTSTIINHGVLTVDNGTIENTSASGAPYAVDNYNTLTVNGGNFVAVRNVIRQAQFGNHDNIVTINGGTFTGYAGLQLHVFSTAKKTETIINGGTFNGTYAMYTSFYTAEASANTSITVNDGTFNGDYALFLYNSKAGAADHAFTAAINGGTFNAPVYVYVNDAEGNSKDLPVIYGGTYAYPVAETLCAEGYIPKDNGNGTYGVEEGKYLVSIEGGKSYATLEEAINAAPAGSTITLMSDVTYEGGLIISKNLTLNLNGNDFTVHGALIVLKGSSLVDSQNGVGKIYVDNEYSLIVSDEEYDPEKAMLPVWMPAAEGEEAYYTLVKVVAQHQGTAENNAFYFKFRPAMVTSDFTADVFADGATNNGLSIEIYIRCYKDGAEVEHLHYVVSEEQIIASYSQGKAIGLYIHGATADIADKYVVSYVIKSHRGITHEVKEAFVYEPVVAVSSDEE